MALRNLFRSLRNLALDRRMEVAEVEALLPYHLKVGDIPLQRPESPDKAYVGDYLSDPEYRSWFDIGFSVETNAEGVRVEGYFCPQHSAATREEPFWRSVLGAWGLSNEYTGNSWNPGKPEAHYIDHTFVYQEA